MAWLSVSKLIIQIASWVSTILVARLLTPDDYGIVAISGIFIGIMTIITDLGMTAGVINADKLSDTQRDTVFWVNVLLGLATFTIAWTSAPFIAKYYQLAELTDVIRTAALTLIITGIRVVPYAMTMRGLNFKRVSIIETIGQGVNISVAISLAYAGFGYWAIVYSVIAYQLVATLLYSLYLGGLPKLQLHIASSKSILTFGIKDLTSASLFYIIDYAPTFIISTRLGQAVTGNYAMAYSLAQMPMEKIGAIFNQVIFPSFSRLKTEAGEARSLFINLHKYLLFITAPMLLGVAIVADDLIILLLGEKWAGSGPILQLICVLNLLRISAMICAPAIKGMGRINSIIKYQILYALTLPVALAIGVNWGAEGAIIAWIILFPWVYSYVYFKLREILHFSFLELVKPLVPVFISSAIMTLGVLLVTDTASSMALHYRLALSITAGALLYALCYMTLFRRELSNNMTALKTLFGK